MKAMKKIFITIIIFGLTISVFAQVNSKNAKIRQMLELTGSGKLGAQIAKQVITSYREQYNYIDQAFWTELEAEIKPDELINDVIPIYSKYYTEDDLDQIISFYNSPVGKKMIESTPFILQESMASGKSWGQKVSEKITKRLKESGYKHN